MDQDQTLWELIGLGSIAGVIPVYLGLAVALLAIRVLPKPFLPDERIGANQSPDTCEIATAIAYAGVTLLS